MREPRGRKEKSASPIGGERPDVALFARRTTVHRVGMIGVGAAGAGSNGFYVERVSGAAGGVKRAGCYSGLTPTSEIVGPRPPSMFAAASAALRVAVRPE